MTCARAAGRVRVEDRDVEDRGVEVRDGAVPGQQRIPGRLISEVKT